MPMKIQRVRCTRSQNLPARVAPIANVYDIEGQRYAFLPVTPPGSVKVRVFEWRWA